MPPPRSPPPPCNRHRRHATAAATAAAHLSCAAASLTSSSLRLRTSAAFSRARLGGEAVQRVIMPSDMSDDDDGRRGSGSDAGGAQEDDSAPALGALKPKRWQKLSVQEYTDCILLRTGIEITESGVTLKTYELHYQCFERYHARIENSAAFPRPDELLHPHKLLACTAFKTQKEWDAWKAQTKHGLGKASVANPTAGVLSEAHAEYIAKKWEKYKLLKREIHDCTQRLWVALIPNNVLPSGTQQVKELVETLRKQMFDVWKFKATSGSRTRYANQEMTGSCANWQPTWWKIWKLMGPAAGVRCSATFMSEIGVKVPQTVEHMPDGLVEHFGAQEEELGGSSANFPLQSKRALQLVAKTNREKEAAQMASHVNSVTPVATPDSAIFSQSRVRAMDTKSLLDVRKHEIQRLTFLRDSEHSTQEEKGTYSLQLFKFMQAPIIPSSGPFSPGFNPPSTPSSSLASSTSTSTLSHLMRSTSKMSMLDAAAGFIPIITIPLENVNHQFAAMSSATHPEENQSFDQDAAELEALNFNDDRDVAPATDEYFVSDFHHDDEDGTDDQELDSDSVAVNMPDLESDSLSYLVTESEWLECIGKAWQVQRFNAGPGSFFSAAAHWINLKLLESNPKLMLSAQAVRNRVAHRIQMQNGRFDALSSEDQFNDLGMMMVDCGQGDASDMRQFNMEDYCNGIRDDWPAGPMELQCMAMIWNVKINVYSRQFTRDTYCCRGSTSVCKMIRVAPNHDENRVFEEFCVIVNDVPIKLGWQETYAQVYRQLPIWNTDIKVVTISETIGRGIIALRRFSRGDVLGIYDGDRCDY